MSLKAGERALWFIAGIICCLTLGNLVVHYAWQQWYPVHVATAAHQSGSASPNEAVLSSLSPSPSHAATTQPTPALVTEIDQRARENGSRSESALPLVAGRVRDNSESVERSQSSESATESTNIHKTSVSQPTPPSLPVSPVSQNNSATQSLTSSLPSADAKSKSINTTNSSSSFTSETVATIPAVPFPSQAPSVTPEQPTGPGQPYRYATVTVEGGRPAIQYVPAHGTGAVTNEDDMSVQQIKESFVVPPSLPEVSETSLSSPAKNSTNTTTDVIRQFFSTRTESAWPFASEDEKQLAARTRWHDKLYRYDWCRDCIDVVIPYVNGSDPWYINALNQFRNKSSTTSDAAGKHRFRDHDELVYCLRSIHFNAPWVRYIHVITNGPQKPVWLNVDDPKIHIVPHSVIFEWSDHLPTFNIYSIKMHIHRIPHLAEKFIYVEDDQMFGRLLEPQTFFDLKRGTTKQFHQTHMIVGTRPHHDDNSEWRALKRSSALLHSHFQKKITVFYPSHVPFAAQRNIYREALEEVWPKERFDSSAERARGDRSLETRLLVINYQKHREPKRFNLTYVFDKLLDVDHSSSLSAEELLGMADLLQLPPNELGALLQYPAPETLGLQSLHRLMSESPHASKLLSLFNASYHWLESTSSTVEADDPGIDFVEMRDEPHLMQISLQSVQAKRPRLFCINDAMREDNPDKRCELLLQQFFDRYFPRTAVFEDPKYIPAKRKRIGLD